MKKLKLTILAIVASIFASSASAFDPADVQKLKNTRNCWECDLSNADLNYANLYAADLSGANLQGAKLIGANLRGAKLIGANLRGAKLIAANLRDADLNYAFMEGVILCNTTMPDGSVIYSGC